MKNRTFVWSWAAAALAAMLLAAGYARIGWAGTDRELRLTCDGKPVATIVVADAPLAASDGRGNPTLTQMTAAEELRKYIEKAGGAKLPIVPASQTPERGTLILVGRSTVSDACKLALPTRPEGLRIVSFPRGIAVLGEIAHTRRLADNTWTDKEVDRGILHAVYAFLERYVGYRFYFQDRNDPDLGIVTPAVKTIALPPAVDFADAPAFTQRLSNLTSLPATRCGSAGHATAGHTHGEAWARRYRESHPEFFMLSADGTRNLRFLCYSEPGVLEAELKHIEQWYATGKSMFATPPATADYIPVWPDDLYPRGGCACERCKAKAGRGYDAAWSEYWWDYVRRLAEEVAQRWPEKRVASGAYTTWLEPPSFPLPGNVCVQLCIHPGGAQTYAHNYMIKQPEIYAKNLSLVSAWSARLGNDPSGLHTREYGFDNTHTGMPILYPHVWQRWLRDLRPLCGGSYFDGICGAGDTPNNYLMTWLQFRLLWDPDLDVDAAVAEHCRAFFGPAGEKLDAFYRLLIERYEQPWPANEVRALSGLGFSIAMLYGETYPPEVLDRLEDLLLAACSSAGLPVEPDWELRSNSAFVLRNTGGAPQVFPVSLAPVNGTVMQPALRWADGELVYRGTLRTGQRLLVEAGRKTTLIEADGTSCDVADRLQGTAPTVAPRATLVMHYSSRQADPRDLLRVTMGETQPTAADKLNLYQRRLRWLRRHFDVHTMGWGRYSPPDGAFVLGRMTQQGLRQGAPAYRVAKIGQEPSADPGAACWQTAETIHLVQGSAAPQNADLNVGLPADLPTQIKLLQDEKNLYALFRCTQFEQSSNENDGIVLRLWDAAKRWNDADRPANWRGATGVGAMTPVLEVAARPDGTLFPAPPYQPWRGQNFGTDTTGIMAQARQRYPAMRTVTVHPARSASVRRDTRQDIGASRYGLYAGHMPSPDGKGLTVFESYLQFNVPALERGEVVARATFRGYLQRHLSPTYPCGVNLNYSADDGWQMEQTGFARLLTLEETMTARLMGQSDDQGRGWYAADVGRYLRKDGEGPGRPLTLGITAAGYQGMRGFAISMDDKNETAPSLDLDVMPADLAEDPWWSVLLVIPKERLAGGRPPAELRADLVRVGPGFHYQWSPALAYIWEYHFPESRRGTVLFEWARAGGPTIPSARRAAGLAAQPSQRARTVSRQTIHRR